jgi:prenyltransferase beta subunit
MTTHLRLNAIYWGLTALCVINHKDALDREEMIQFVMSCWDDDAGQFFVFPVQWRITITPNSQEDSVPILTMTRTFWPL